MMTILDGHVIARCDDGWYITVVLPKYVPKRCRKHSRDATLTTHMQDVCKVLTRPQGRPNTPLSNTPRHDRVVQAYAQYYHNI